MRGRGALVFATAVAALGPAAAEPCVPRAALDGDAAAVARVTAELERLGVRVELRTAPRTGAGCPVLVAAVELERGGDIAVAVRDGTNRSEGRVLSDAALAAAWIDSWIHDDFAAPPPSAPLAESAPVARAVDRAPPVVVAMRGLLDRFAIEGGYVRSFAFDGSQATGVGAAACARVDAFCIGLRGSITSQQLTSSATGANRGDSALLATVSWAHELGRMTVAPELALGVGRITTTRIDGCKPPPPSCDPQDPTCASPGDPPPMCTSPDPAGTAYVGDHLDASTFTPRLGATLRVAVPLFDHVWLDGIASVTLAPLGHTDAFTPAVPIPGVPLDQLVLPGEPLGSAQLGIALRVGVP